MITLHILAGNKSVYSL